MAKCKYIET